MTVKQKLEIEQSELREAINLYAKTIADGSDSEWTDEERTQKRSEYEEKARRFDEIEPALRAAIQAEAEQTEKLERGDFDQETLELRALTDQATLGGFLAPALIGRNEVEGVEKELVQALKIQPSGMGVDLPLFMLTPPGEIVRQDGSKAYERADVVTSLAAVKNQEYMGSYLRRLFLKKACTHLGITMESAMVGERNHTVITGGTSAGTVARGAGKDAAALTMSVETLDPHRITSRVIWETIDIARIPELESQIRYDIGMVFSTAMEKEIWDGDDGSELSTQGIKAGVNAVAAQVETVNAPLGRTGANIRTDMAESVDGLYATGPQDVKTVASTRIYKYWLNKADPDINQLALDTLMGQKYNIIASNYIEDGDGNLANGDYLSVSSKANGLENAYVVAVWPTVGMILDRVTKAKEGQVILTLEGMWDQKMIRAANFMVQKAAAVVNE